MTGSELPVVGLVKTFLASKAAEEAQKSIAGAVVKSAWSGGTDGIKQANFGDRIQQAIFDASGQYISSFADRHGILKVLGMMQPVWIEDIYTRVQFLGNEGIRQYLSLENLEEAYRETQKRRFQSEQCQKRDGLEVANEQQYLMVLGQPGAGKSTFLRRVGLEALKRENSEYQHDCIPVFLELKRFNTGDLEIEKAIAREFTTCNFPDPERSTKRLLEDGKLLVLLDGLDEVPTQHLDQAITQIQDFCDRYRQNRFIASCRTAAYRSRFRQFTDLIVADFDDQQIQQFITNWFSSREDQQVGTAEKCWELLQQPEYESTRELAQTPLLLTFLCLVFDDSQTFPKQRAILYKEALDVLLKKWAAEKRIQRDPIYQDLTLPLEEMMLAEIACKGFEANRLFFSKREVVEQIRTFLANNLNAPHHLDGEGILEAIQIQQGILVERARDVLSFSHLTLQEYLAAQYVADNNLVESMVTDYLFDTRWREVFLLVGGLMRGGADNLLLKIEAKAQELLLLGRIKILLKWADEVTADAEGNFKSISKRVIVIYLACILSGALTPDFAFALSLALDHDLGLILTRAIARDFTFALVRNLSPTIILNRALDLARQIREINVLKNSTSSVLIARLQDLTTQILDSSATFKEYRAFVDSVLRVWYDPIRLQPEWVALSEAEVKALENYLYANELLVRCKEAAVRVSPKVWEGIEERMLTVGE